MQYKIRSRLPILVFASLSMFLKVYLQYLFPVLRHLIYLISIKLVLDSGFKAVYLVWVLSRLNVVVWVSHIF